MTNCDMVISKYGNERDVFTKEDVFDDLFNNGYEGYLEFEKYCSIKHESNKCGSCRLCIEEWLNMTPFQIDNIVCESEDILI